MKYLDKLLNRKLALGESVKNVLVKQDYKAEKQLLKTNFKIMPVDERQIGGLRKMFEPYVRQIVKETESQGINNEKIYKAVIPPEFIEGMKNGKFKFMKANDGSLLPNIVDGNNHIIKKIRVEEMELAPQHLNTINQLSDKLLNQKLDAISQQLDVIIDLAKEINQQLKNQTYAKILGAIDTIDQSKLEKRQSTRKQLQNHAQVLLNEAISVLKQEIEGAHQYFINWDKRTPYINIYSTKNLERKFNQLMKDYLFFTNAKSALVNLKRAQGIKIEDLRSMTEDLREIDRQFKDAGIRNWLPPQNNDNKWQHDLMDQMEINNAQLVIEYKVEELL